MDDVLDLREEELREAATAVIDAAGDTPKEPFGIYFIRPASEESVLARALEQKVFLETFGNTPDLLQEEYGRYEPHSIFIVALDHARRLPAGMGRFTLPSELGYKTLHDIERFWHQDVDDVLARTGRPWDLDRVWDAGTFAVADDYRRNSTGGMVSLGLLAAVNRAMLLTGCNRFVTVLDVNVFTTFNELLYEAYEPFPGVEPLSYLDSPLSIPCFVDADRHAPMVAAADPFLHRVLYEGVGIETVVRNPSFGPVLALAGVAADLAVVRPSTSPAPAAADSGPGR